MSEHIIKTTNMPEHIRESLSVWYEINEEIVRCRDCKHLDDSEYRRWDNYLAECYGEPPLFCDLLSFNKWRMDGDRRVAETTFLEVEPNDFCKWGERREK